MGKHKYFGVIATNENGSTVAMDLINASQVSKRVGELIDSGCSVRLFECRQIDFDVERGATVVHVGGFK